MRDFKKLNIWSEGIQIVKEVYLIAKKLPSDEKFGLKSQITRAAVSIPSNIAEGSGRNSEIEFKRFLEISLGSLFELQTQLIIIQELNLIESKDLILVFELLEKEGKMINGFIKTVKNNL